MSAARPPPLAGARPAGYAGPARPVRRRRGLALADDAELVQLVLLACLCGLFGALLPAAALAAAVISVALAYAAVLGAACLRQIRASRVMVWSPLVWFRVGSGVIMGLGTVVPYVADDRTRAYLDGIYPFTDQEALKFLTVVILSTLTVLAVARPFRVRRRAAGSGRLPGWSASSLLLAAVVFLIVGGIMRYGITVPRIFGLTDMLVAGWVTALSKAYVAGLFLLLLWSLRHQRRLLFLPVLLIAADVLVGVLAFDKSEILLTLVFTYLAVLYSRFTLARAVTGFAAAFAILVVTQPLVHYGRGQLTVTDGIRTATVGERIAILRDYLNREEAVRVDSPARGALIRLSIVNVGTWVIGRHDRGLPGNAHVHAFAALVPRVLWPEKPLIGAAGAQAYYLLRGWHGPSLGVGHFAEAYWSFGWLGIPLVFVPGGLILVIMTLRCVGLLVEERWFQLPVILFAISVAYKVEGSWVPTVVGSFAIFVVMSVVFALVERALWTFLAAAGPRAPPAPSPRGAGPQDGAGALAGAGPRGVADAGDGRVPSPATTS